MFIYRIKASANSDVSCNYVKKQGNECIRHAYIKACGNHTFKVGDGSYQTFISITEKDGTLKNIMKNIQVVGKRPGGRLCRSNVSRWHKI